MAHRRIIAFLLIFCSFSLLTTKALSNEEESDDDMCTFRIASMEKTLRDLVKIKAAHANCPTSGNSNAETAEITQKLLMEINENVRNNSQAIGALQKIVQEMPVQKNNFPCNQTKDSLIYFNRELQKIYLFIEKKESWYRARSLCEGCGMELASPTSRIVIRTLKKIMPFKNEGDHYWTSGNDIGRTPGEFFWENLLSKVNTDAWDTGSGDPNSYGAGKETCIYLHNDVLSDHPCDTDQYFFCEADALKFL